MVLNPTQEKDKEGSQEEEHGRERGKKRRRRRTIRGKGEWSKYRELYIRKVDGIKEQRHSKKYQQLPLAGMERICGNEAKCADVYWPKGSDLCPQSLGDTEEPCKSQLT